MSQDYIQNRAGVLQLNGLPVYGSTGTASTIASNQYPAGYQFGAYVGFAAGSNSTNGGAPYVPYLPAGTATNDFQSFATTGMITHDNRALVHISISTTGIALNLQPPTYDGQLLTIVNNAGTTGSIVSTINTTGVGGTTTAACQVLRGALTLASTNVYYFQAQKLGQTASTNLPYVWSNIGFCGKA
jgi:hypothetical protein